jgi:hypothetical protein
MLAVWGLLVPAGIIAVRFFKHKPVHSQLHKWTMLTGMTLTLPAAGNALLQIGEPSSLAHANLGLSLAITLIAEVVVGALIRSWLRSDKQPPKYWMTTRFFHKVVGWTMYAAGGVNCTLGAGILLPEWGGWIVLGYFMALSLTMIVLAFYDEKKRDEVSRPGIMKMDVDNRRRVSISQSSQSLTMQEVRANVRAGCKW